MARLLHRLESREFTVTVEIDPPKSADVTKTLTKVRRFADRVDGVNVADCPMANVRMSPITLAHLIQRDAGVEAIFHLTCRDRNVIGLQAELLGAAGLGVQNILCLRGDEPTRGDHPEAKAVFELDAVGLIKLADGLNRGKLLSGGDLEAPSRFAVACAANPGADDLEGEVSRLEAKIAAGAHFAQTQPIFDPRVLERWLAKIQGRITLPILYGIMPLKSHAFALHLNQNVPGMKVPDWLVQRMEGADEAVGIKLAGELVTEIATWGIHGIHLFPMGSTVRVNGLLDALAAAGIRPAPKGLVAAGDQK
ncbi:MAG TPA: methylenetetrahydrofolate reductase [Symbiobacteriaceae bacterium]|nr:methylenetetrahydrofolate reductase [Symbiobacteriaceae bacterium]